MATRDQEVVESLVRHLEGRKFRLLEERGVLTQAATRIANIDEEIVILDAELARIRDRRPPRPA